MIKLVGHTNKEGFLRAQSPYYLEALQAQRLILGWFRTAMILERYPGLGTSEVPYSTKKISQAREAYNGLVCGERAVASIGRDWNLSPKQTTHLTQTRSHQALERQIWVHFSKGKAHAGSNHAKLCVISSLQGAE